MLKNLFFMQWNNAVSRERNINLLSLEERKTASIRRFNEGCSVVNRVRICRCASLDEYLSGSGDQDDALGTAFSLSFTLRAAYFGELPWKTVSMDFRPFQIQTWSSR